MIFLQRNRKRTALKEHIVRFYNVMAFFVITRGRFLGCLSRDHGKGKHAPRLGTSMPYLFGNAINLVSIILLVEQRFEGGATMKPTFWKRAHGPPQWGLFSASSEQAQQMQRHLLIRPELLQQP